MIPEGQSADQIEDFNLELARQSVVDGIVEHVVSTNKIKDPDDVIALCTECGSAQDSNRMMRDPFANQGYPPACKYCGGVCTITYAEVQAETYEQITYQRGIS